MELWRDVPGQTGRYAISDQGRVRSLLRPRIMHPTPAGAEGRKYLSVELQLPGGGHTMRRVHLLVLEAFVGPKPEGMEGRHLNGNRNDNRLSNLAYGTHSENERDKLRHGTNRNIVKTKCPRGHDYSPENTRLGSRGERKCRTCHRDWERDRRNRPSTPAATIPKLPTRQYAAAMRSSAR